MTYEQADQLLQTTAHQLAATQATGILLTRAVYWLVVLTQLSLVLIFFAAMRRWGK